MGHKREVIRQVEFDYDGEHYTAQVWSTKSGKSKAEKWSDDELIEHKKMMIDRFKLHKIKPRNIL
jgi:hypothetical protein